MPREKTIKLYQIGELTGKAKEKARDWFRQYVFQDSCDWEFVYEDAEKIAELFGLTIAQKSYKTVGGKTRQEPAIYFSGFSSQGDGACFEGSYEYKADAIEAVKGYAPVDEELHAIVTALQSAQEELKGHGFTIGARVTHSGRYSHSGMMDFEYTYSDEELTEAASSELLHKAEEEVKTQLRAFADWIYEKLEAEYQYQTSDEAVDESCAANEYEFTETGERCVL